MSEARQEAERRWPEGGDLPDLLYPRAAMRHSMRGAFVAGAEWQAAQPVEITDVMVERAAKAIHGVVVDLREGRPSWEKTAPILQEEYKGLARAALEAARGGGRDD